MVTVLVRESPDRAWLVSLDGGTTSRFGSRGLALWFARRECAALAPARLVVTSRRGHFTERFGGAAHDAT